MYLLSLDNSETSAGSVSDDDGVPNSEDEEVIPKSKQSI